MNDFFDFETDFVATLRCIPMQVRLKLDTCGIKLKLPQWHQFSPAERQVLVERPCDTESNIRAYREILKRFVNERTGVAATELLVETEPAWMNATAIPDTVFKKAQEVKVTVTSIGWANLTPLQRFALLKLSQSGHENANFLPALKEFHLA